MAAVLTRSRVVPSLPVGRCLDFANTRYWRGTETPTEALTDVGSLIRWLVGADVVDRDTAASLRTLQRRDAAAAHHLLGEAIGVRENIYRMGLDFAEGARRDPDLEWLNRLLAAAPPRLRLHFSGKPAGWKVPMVSPSVAEVLAPILWSAADLALAVHRRHLRCCANDRCRWLFLDDSKSGTRRWCSMASCGNRSKARRHAAREAARREEG
jgi:predicted RNA-binding Zn ribbon-like protein